MPRRLPPQEPVCSSGRTSRRLFTPVGRNPGGPGADPRRPEPRAAGPLAAKFTVKPGDDPISGGERAEVWWNSHEHEGTESWWRWSTFFPKGFHPNRGYWNFFPQWHHTGTTCMPPVELHDCNPAPPPSFACRSGAADSNTSTCSPQYQHLWNIGKLRRHHWYRFVFHVKWSSYPSKDSSRLRVNGHTRSEDSSSPLLYRGYGST